MGRLQPTEPDSVSTTSQSTDLKGNSPSPPLPALPLHEFLLLIIWYAQLISDTRKFWRQEEPGGMSSRKKFCWARVLPSSSHLLGVDHSWIRGWGKTLREF